MLYFIPDWFPKYKNKLLEHHCWKRTTRVAYSDLDNDTWSEKITSDDYPNGTCFINIQDHNNKLINEWDFKGTRVDVDHPFMIGDYNHNAYQEIYLLTQKEDSLFAWYFEPLNKSDNAARMHFIGVSGKYSEKHDLSFYPGEVTDLNGDEAGEAIFAVVAGFCKQPRNVFAWDIKKDTIYSSTLSGAQLGKISLFDLNGDGRREILANCYAPGNNLKNEFPYDDSSSWLMVFDQHLDFLFKPVEYRGRTANTWITPFRDDSGSYLIVRNAVSNTEFSQMKVSIVNEKGEIVCNRRLNVDIHRFMTFFSMPDQGFRRIFSVMHNQKEIIELNKQLDTINKINTGFENFEGDLHVYDIDADGSNEVLYVTEKGNALLVLRNDLSHGTLLRISGSTYYPLFSVKKNGKAKPTFVVNDGDEFFEYAYYRNNLYYFKFPFYLGIYIFISYLIWFVQALGRIQIKKQIEINTKIGQLQTLVLQNQIDPHFTLNAMNSIGSVILQNKPEEAYDYMSSFSNLIRSSLLSAQSITRTLSEELDFVENYLRLEQLRMNNKFTYEISINDKIDQQILIPKMLIQIFAENAVKHGLSPKENKGLLTISITPASEPSNESKTEAKKDSLLITIEDNGIGRKAASEQTNNSTGRGLSVIDQLLDIFNNNNTGKITYMFVDLYDENDKPVGSRVEISFPFELY